MKKTGFQVTASQWHKRIFDLEYINIYFTPQHFLKYIRDSLQSNTKLNGKVVKFFQL